MAISNGNLTYDKKTAERKTPRKRNKWGEWAKQVKHLTKQALEEITEENERMELTKSGDAQRKSGR